MAGALLPTQDDSLCATVVAWRQGSESLLSRSILEKNKKKTKEKTQLRLKGHREKKIHPLARTEGNPGGIN